MGDRAGADERRGVTRQLFAFFDRPLLVFLDMVLVAPCCSTRSTAYVSCSWILGVGITHRREAVFWICMLIAAAAVWGFAYKAIPFIF